MMISMRKFKFAATINYRYCEDIGFQYTLTLWMGVGMPNALESKRR